VDISAIAALAPVVPVLTIERTADAVPLARALVKGGLPVLEITLRTEAALAALAAIVPLFVVQAAWAASNDLPLIDHVVVVVLENHSFDQIVDPHRAPFIHQLATDGALFVNAFAVSHPSQPNYFALFSGSTQGISDNEDHTFDEPTLAGALTGAGKSFIGYVETGSPRKHNPWESFVNARATERNFSEFPRDFTRLPTTLAPYSDRSSRSSSSGFTAWARSTRAGTFFRAMNTR